jgi:hypothetical protein
MIEGEAGEFCRFCGDFLIDCQTMRLIRCFGDEAVVNISNHIEAVAAGCLYGGASVSSVEFPSDCRVSVFGESAFAYCSLRQSICIPSSLERIGNSGFQICEKLSDVTFERGSKMSTLAKSAFFGCSALESICCIPSSIEQIPKNCFYMCRHLSNLTFGRGSRITILGEDAFSFCMSLQSICIPPSICLAASIETIAGDCFRGCESLVSIVLKPGSTLSAESLSRLRSKYEVALK